ncbi:GNAT family N-acetyltransferase [Chitinimonas sp. PSY-7]|uniref:GNAT family N-acetyltransferase n=1 Tax=Chitinimonas sp. PSY-7 TaxID=3459088 RepID=UPI0040403B44
MLPSTLADARLDALSETDFETVARLGNDIWRSHYAKMISMAQIDFMLAGRYAANKLRSYLDSDSRWMMLLRLADEPVGYCSYAHTEIPGELKLEQLYLLQEHKGKGLGGLMLRHVETQARKLGMRVLLLQVNKQNADAIAVYRKAGFTVREEAVFDIGGGYVMDDYVMEKVL